jgi:hypothetical protein
MWTQILTERSRPRISGKQRGPLTLSRVYLSVQCYLVHTTQIHLKSILSRDNSNCHIIDVLILYIYIYCGPMVLRMYVYYGLLYAIAEQLIMEILKFVIFWRKKNEKKLNCPNYSKVTVFMLTQTHSWFSASLWAKPEQNVTELQMSLELVQVHDSRRIGLTEVHVL